MPNPIGERAIKQSIVQFRDPQGKVRGCGLLVDSLHIATCAHVIALVIPGVHSTQPGAPQDPVSVVFPYCMPELGATARIIVWKPEMHEAPHDMVEDIAVLKLDRPVPKAGGTLLETDWAGRYYMAHGFPESNSKGNWADGKFKGEVVSGWVQMVSHDGTDLQVDHGFSGGGVWDEQLQGFAGIMVANKERGNQRKPVSYMIPGALLRKAWKDIPEALHDATIGFQFGADAVPIAAETSAVSGNHDLAMLNALRAFCGKLITIEDLLHHVVARLPIPTEYRTVTGLPDLFRDSLWRVIKGELKREGLITALSEVISPNQAKLLVFRACHALRNV